MEFRKAEMRDLPLIKATYTDIVSNMRENGVDIWDEVYPIDFFEEDIQRGELYLLTDGTFLAAAFALCRSCDGEKTVSWTSNSARAIFIDRFGVNPSYSRRGIGSLMIEKARKTAANLGAEYLRLFVVDVNVPAIKLYEKLGFTRASGVYQEVIDDELTLNEFGYEIKVI